MTFVRCLMVVAGQTGGICSGMRSSFAQFVVLAHILRGRRCFCSEMEMGVSRALSCLELACVRLSVVAYTEVEDVHWGPSCVTA